MPWVIKRLLRSVLLGWAVASVVILATRLAPGDAVQQHYLTALSRLLAGDLGRSVQSGRLVTTEIASRLPSTLLLIAASALLAMLIGIPSGFFAAITRNGPLDRIATAASGFALAIPVFVAGLVLTLLFGVPAAMPVITIAIGLSAMTFRSTRAAVSDVMQRDFVRTARAKGLGRRRILLHHVLRNAWAPLTAALAPYLGILLGGTALVEYVFHYPGVFALLIDAVKARDYPIVAGVVLVASSLVIAVQLVADLICAAVDPRFRIA